MYTDQPTPPFNSPYQQHASRSSALLQSAYPSPGQNNLQSKVPHGLGLYGFHQPMPIGLPPSPQHSEVWAGHCSSVASPMVTEALADPYTSGAFDHPVDRSPVPWASAQTSPRSSLSPYTREMSVLSHEGSESVFPGVKSEGTVWGSEMSFGTNVSPEMMALSSSRQHAHTVAPERLNTGLYPYGNADPSPGIPRYEPAPTYEFDNRDVRRAPSEASFATYHFGPRPTCGLSTGASERPRNRRNTDPAHSAYRCTICQDKGSVKGFARKYNYDQHMLTHDSSRKKDHVCPYPDCGQEFVRKADLTRHNQSIHQPEKKFKCSLCPSAFARKDTLRRYIFPRPCGLHRY